MNAQQLKPYTVKQLLKVLKSCSRHLEQSYHEIGQSALWSAAIEAGDAHDFLLDNLYSNKSKTN